MATITDIARYPVKGLSGQSLAEAMLAPGKTIADDRAFAIAHGETDFDPGHPVHLRKTHFLTLMTHPRLALLAASFNAASFNSGDSLNSGDAPGSVKAGATRLTLRRGGETVFSGDLATAAGRASCSAFFDDFIGDESRGPPVLVTAPGLAFTDIAAPSVSLMNLASVRALEPALGRPVDPKRFRANILVDGLRAWEERDWPPGTELVIGGARLRVTGAITRCAATNVNLQNAERDLNIPRTLLKSFGGNQLGVYARVESAGIIRQGDALDISGDSRT